MKKLFTLLLLAILSSNIYVKSSGGPDAYGYTWTASTDAGGPTYSWIDISGTGTLVTGLFDDNAAPGMFNIGFPFHYYWSDYTQIKVGSNGWISFDPISNIASCFPTIPTAGGVGDNILAALMSDLNFTGAGNPGQVQYWSNNVDSFIVAFINVPFWSASAPGWTGQSNFEVILCGADSSITYQYQGATTGFLPNAGCIDMTIGIENSTGNIGLQVFSDVVPPSDYAVKFKYPNPVLLSVQDITPKWNNNSLNAAEFHSLGWLSNSSNIKNVGNTNVLTTINLANDIRNLAMVSVYSAAGSLPSLAAGADTTFIFTPMANVAAAGQYFNITTISNANDINASNNTSTSELNFVDLCQPNMTLTYATGGAATGSINWNGGANDDGVAIYIKPPVYPVTINSLEYFISSNVGNGYISQIIDDDGPSGTPGTILFNTTIASGTVISGAWNTVTVNPTVTINDGGFYVVWFQGGTSIFIGTETNGPMSRRCLEILDGAYADFRYNSQQDLMIRANVSGYPNVVPANFTSVINGNTVDFTNLSPGAAGYIWDFGDGNTANTFDASHTYAPGYYTACLTDTNACGMDSMCTNIFICGQVAAGFSNTDSATTVVFTDMSANFPDTWAWDFGDGNTDTIQNPTHVYAAQGMYTVCLIISNVCGSDTICQNVFVCDVPVVGFTHADSFTTVVFTDTSTNIPTTWAWDFGDGNTDTIPSPTHTYASPGTYTACLIISNACGSDTVCTQITVCDQPVAAFTGVLVGSTITLTNASTFGGYLWNFCDGGISMQPDPVYTWALPGTYCVCLTVTSVCGTDSTTCQYFTVCAPPSAGFSLTTSGDTVVFSDTSTSTAGGTTWSWDFDGLNSSTLQNPTFVFPGPGNYDVCLVVSDSCSSDTICQTITIATGIDDSELKALFSVYPNPNYGILNIHSGSNEIFTLRIFDMNGREVIKKEILSGENLVDMKDASSGIYSAILSFEEKVVVYRVVKE